MKENNRGEKEREKQRRERKKEKEKRKKEGRKERRKERKKERKKEGKNGSERRRGNERYSPFLLLLLFGSLLFDVVILLEAKITD